MAITAGLSSVDTHTPSELRAIPLIADAFTPAPPAASAVPLPRRRVSRLPILCAKPSGAGQFLTRHTVEWHHGQILLQKLALNQRFLNLWTKIIPETERAPLDKILKKSKL
ncbi:Ribosomal RNA small subunit methyltransferase A [Dissostichus eleginoides]|uniref:Ribosomal RNA small subunit methyltransferase A n=1 Tax=Dissostichus eleginoides TaxID=100907 RepID=A0AAD9EVJ3_DISEL|nr:Ribosomal RNA small subunit methyltransferase A [Dissostichus eleginoides]